MISLFPHNETAYHAAEEMLAETGKAAIIHPTGTGKSFIGFKLCETHADETVCWLSPSSYIFETQIENLKKITGGYVPENITFFTYAKLMLMSEAELTEIQPDYIILDEFHRAGASEWQNGVHALLHCYPNVPILGLSATAIRYLDNQRDMADELFDGNVVSEMTLGEAIARGILAAPKYVVTLYSYQKELEQYERRIRNAPSKIVRDEVERYLQALRRALDKSDGLDEIFRKHMTNPHGKYIVFTANFEAMQECAAKVSDWFGKVDTAPHVYQVYSADPTASRAFQAFKADTDTDHLRLLFAIDALNEGVHVDNVDGVILFRPTVSPIIYKQQIGRALAAGKSGEPVIFDIVNNFENLYSIGSIEEEMRAAITYYRFFGDGNEIVTDSFKIIDELRECRKLFDELEGTLTASWELMYSHAKAYYDANGNLDVPRRYKTIDGYSLGEWLQTQRQIRSGKETGNLDEIRIAKLDEIGMRWESVNDLSWERHYRACVKYTAENGNLNVPGDYVTDSGILLGRWIKQVRVYRKSGIKSSYFTPEREELLNTLGMIWDVPDYLWERNYAAALDYYRQHGNINVPKGCVRNGVKLDIWLAECKQIYRGTRGDRKLTASQIERLEELGIQWLSKSEAAWETGLAEAKLYYAEHGVFDAPYSYIAPSGHKLGVWLSKYREKYAKGKLTEEQVQELESIGIVWNNARKNNWDDCYEKLRAYYAEHGDLNLPGDYVADGIWLAKWLNEQKQIFRGSRKGKKLSEEQLRKLSEIGFTAEDTFAVRWNRNFETIKNYHTEHGHANIPVNYTDASGQKLYVWLSNQKQLYKAGKLDGRRADALRSIGVIGE